MNATQKNKSRHARPAQRPLAVRFAALFSALIGFLALGLPVHAAPVIGTAPTVVRDVKGLLQQAWRVVIIDDNVHQDEVIKTGDDSAARLVFADRTDFMVGSNSEVILDKFIYDANANSGQLILRATKGLMKFRTGQMSSRSYRIDTPVATVGVRGTEFVIQILEGGATYIKVIEGEVVISDRNQATISIKPGETAVVYPPDDHRAGGGPILLEKSNFALNDETREMISQIVFSESNAQTQIAATGKQAASVLLNGQGFQVNPLAGQNNPSVGVKPVGAKPPQAPRQNNPQQHTLLPNSPFFQPPLPCILFIGGFDDCSSGLTFNGRGKAAVITDPFDPLNKVLQMTTGSPVEIEQSFEPPGGPFTVSFKRRFTTGEGELCVFVEEDDGAPPTGETRSCEDDNPLLRLAADGVDTAYVLETINVTDPALYLLDKLVLALLFEDEASGETILLDDFLIEPLIIDVEQPADVPLLPAAAFMAGGAAMLGLAARRQRRAQHRR